MTREYIAFISYRHLPLDRFLAKQLHRRIERWLLPKAHRADGQKHLGIVFRDQDELPLSNNLSQNIYDALEHSRYLIVICTPETSKSKWVEREIEYFIQIHGRDRVLIVLADGTPETSIPRQLTEIRDSDGNVIGYTEPLCANLISPFHHTWAKQLFSFFKLRGDEFLRLAASILNVPFDSLKQRARKRQARIKSITLGLIIALLTVFAGILTAWNMEVTALNEDLNEQFRQAQMNESQALSLLSQTQLDQGDRMGAVQSALQALPTSEETRAYSDSAIYALTQALHLYQDTGYAFHDLLDHGTQIINFAVSPSGKYGFFYDNRGQGSLYDLGQKTKQWEVELVNPYYVSRDSVDNILILEDENRIYVDCLGSIFIYELESGARLDVQEEGEYYYPIEDTERFCHGYICSSTDAPVMAVWYSAYEAWDSSYQYNSHFEFYRWERQQLSLSEDVSLPSHIKDIDTGIISPDGTQFIGTFLDETNQNVHIVTIEISTGKIKDQSVISYEYFPSTPTSRFNEIPYHGRLTWLGNTLAYANGETLVVLDPEQRTILSTVTFPATMLDIRLCENDLLVILDDGTVLRYDPADIDESPEVLADCGFPLNQAYFCGSDSDRIMITPNNSPAQVITMTRCTDAESSPCQDPALEKGTGYWEFLPLPDREQFLVYGHNYQQGTSDRACSILIYNNRDLSIASEYHFSTEQYSLNGLCADGNSVILESNCLDLDTGEWTPLYGEEYVPDDWYPTGETYGVAQNWMQNPQQISCVATYHPEPDVLTWWENGEIHSSTSPYDLVSNYGWQSPCPLVDIGSNGLILIRNYIGSINKEMSAAPDLDRSRPIGYAVFSTKEQEWRYWDNECQAEGIPPAGMALTQPWIAFVDYDGYIRVYDWNSDSVIYQIPTDIPGHSVTEITFIKDDSVLMVRHQTDHIAAIQLSDGAVLGDYIMTNASIYDSLSVWQVPEQNCVYLSDTEGALTGLCISTDSWEVTVEIPRLICPIPECNYLLRWNSQEDGFIASPIYSLDELIVKGNSLISGSNQ